MSAPSAQRRHEAPTERGAAVSDGFRVDDAALDAHARQVDDLAAQTQRAAEAGRPLDLMAYGLVGQVFALAAAGATDTGSVAVGTLARRIVELGAGVRASRDDYLRVERQNATSFRAPR